MWCSAPGASIPAFLGITIANVTEGITRKVKKNGRAQLSIFITIRGTFTPCSLPAFTGAFDLTLFFSNMTIVYNFLIDNLNQIKMELRED
ncbi:hypothetical protein ACFL9U_06145 [Thermodesulfobacteriota bacterium]